MGHGKSTWWGVADLGLRCPTSGDPAPRPRGGALTSATLAPGRGAELWKVARGEGAGPLDHSGRKPGSGANVEAAASRGATRALTAAMATGGQRGRRVTGWRGPARNHPAAPAQSSRPRYESAGGRGHACAVAGRCCDSARVNRWLFPSVCAAGWAARPSAPAGLPQSRPARRPVTGRMLPTPVGSGSRPQCVPGTAQGPGHRAELASVSSVIHKSHLRAAKSQRSGVRGPQVSVLCLRRDPDLVRI